MATTLLMEPAFSQALSAAIIPKLSEVGWSTGADDDGAIAEYIVLLVMNGKSQQEIAGDLCGDLLGLGPDDPQALMFSDWLFRQIETLKSQGTQTSNSQDAMQDVSMNDQQDGIMHEASEAGEPSMYAISTVDPCSDLCLPHKPRILTRHLRPTGPKSMRNGGGARSDPRDKRMLGHLAKAMDRSNDSVLHRVRGASGNERINSHRGPPTGPRQPMSIRGGARNMNGRSNGMGMRRDQNQSMATDAAAQAQMLYAMLQQQQQFFNMLPPENQKFLQQQMSGQVAPVFNPNFKGRQQGKPLIDRVQAPTHRGQNSFRNNNNNGNYGNANDATTSSSMDVQMTQEKPELSPDTTCRYNLACTNKDCKFAHQSPEAPPGTAIDVTDTCLFGAACKNRKCTGRHPSPAQRIAHQTEMDCKYFPACTNARCPFRHPSAPACRNGADCTIPGCTFTHNKTVCKFNPCLNAACIYKHEEGQKRGKFEDKVWVAKEHISERKFVDDSDKPEELIIPGEALSQASSATAELIT